MLASVFGPLKTPPRLARFYWLDLIRGLAALSVLVWHYQHLYYPQAGVNGLIERSVQPFYPLLSVFYNFGGSAVQLFWVISGFVFSAVYLGAGPITAKTFFVNRFARLYPLHLLTLMIVAILQAISWRMTGHFQIYPENDWYHALLNLGFVSRWGFERGLSFNEPIWSVSLEVMIYFVFFFSIPWILRRGTAVLLGLFALFSILAHIHFPGPFWWCGSYFYLGCLVFDLFSRFGRKTWVMLAVSGVGIAFSTAVTFVHEKYVNSPWQLMTLFPSIVLLAATLDLADRKAIGRNFRALGDVTYGVYLWHVPIQITLLIIFQAWAVDLGILGSKAFFTAYVLFVIGFSYLSFRLFEFPARTWFRKFGEN